MVAMASQRGPEVGDAFGVALLEALERGESQVVIERDDGLVRVDEISENYFGPPQTWGERDRWALDRAQGRVLDIGAGAGRAALALQDRAQDVVALDISPGALRVCERRGVHQCFLGTVEELAAATPETFDTFLALGNNLGLLEGPRRAHKLRYHAANRQRGRLAGQVTIRVRHRQLATRWFNLLWCSLEELAELCEPAGWTITDVFPGALYGVVLQHAR
jgi:SAM-dependent methyltransferase